MPIENWVKRYGTTDNQVPVTCDPATVTER